MPFFSVIVPIYKTEPYLRQCVDSILGQSFRDFEVILVDDGSPDGCGAICDAYAAEDSRVRVIHKENGGLVSARKAGALLCTGEYILNVDSDDYIAPELMEKLAQIIHAHAPDVVTFDGYRFTEGFQELFRSTMAPGFYRGDSMREIRENVIQNSRGETAILYGVCLKAIRKALYLSHQTKVPESLSRGEDLAVTAPLLTGCDSVYLSDIPGYFYRDNPESIMNTFSATEIRQMKLLIRHLSACMTPAFHGKLDMYVLTHYFDFLDRAMLSMTYREYRKLICETLDDELFCAIRRAKCPGVSSLSIISFLLRHRLFGTLWLLRKIRKRAA